MSVTEESLSERSGEVDAVISFCVEGKASEVESIEPLTVNVEFRTVASLSSV